MIPRSQAGRAIVASATGASQAKVQSAPDRVTRLEKPNRDVKLGLRFGLHPQTNQVIVSELYSGARRTRQKRGASQPHAPP